MIQSLAHRGPRRVCAAAAAGSLFAATLIAVATMAAVPASADSVPADASTPSTVTADPLPTMQVDGVVWDQAIIGNTVYVAGEFTYVRPAGVANPTAAQDAGEIRRNNLAAYNINTGELVQSWTANTDAQVLAIEASPDGQALYVGGQFTSIYQDANNPTAGAVTLRRMAALSPSTGQPITSFNPNPDATVNAVAVSTNAVYFGGAFGRIGPSNARVTRSRVASVNPANGGALPWAPTVTGSPVRAIALSPTSDRVLLGGSFTAVNGSNNPGYGLAALDATSGALVPWASNSTIRNGGTSAAITSLTTSGNDVYSTGFVFGAGGNLEGLASMSWNGGALNWISDCHGDTYDSATLDQAVYVAGHAHYCGNHRGGFPETATRSFNRAMAFSKAATGVLMNEYLGYANFAGQPSPSILHWFPEVAGGTYTGQDQGGWTMESNANYMVMAGEFPTVGRVSQQGLVRFARTDNAPNEQKFDNNGSSTNPLVRSVGDGEVVISWPANLDADNEFLTYKVVRNNNVNSPIYEVTTGSGPRNQPWMSFLDTGLTPGTSVTYRLITVDPTGYETRSNQVPVVISGSGNTDAYAQSVVESGPTHYWRLDDASGRTVQSFTGNENAETTDGVTRGSAGAISGNASTTFSGSNGQTAYTNNIEATPSRYTVEAWVNTDSTRGGKIIGFGNAKTGSSGTQDRHLYFGSDGRLNFGSRQGSARNVITSSASYNDAQWHHVVGAVDDDGMRLYVNGVKVAQRADTRIGHPYRGYWRIGGDNLSGWANRPSSDFLAGSVDEAAVYARALTGAEIRAHYTAAGRNAGLPADAYGQAVTASGADLFWRFAEAGGNTVADSSANGSQGTRYGGPGVADESAVGLSGDRSIIVDGNDDAVARTVAAQAPAQYSEELWFRTNSTSGGRLLGFSNSASGTSSRADRALYLRASGQVAFTNSYGSARPTVVSSRAYNDNNWHHVVATQGTNGMKLYVDQVLVAEDASATANESFSGFWRAGGDSLAGVPARPTSDYVAGRLDEVAVYERVLTPAEIRDHYRAAGGAPANTPPTARFTVSASDLVANFDASTSTDSDGTIAGYAWAFGDGTTGTGRTVQHTYAAAGTYQVTLTVTDDKGAVGTRTQAVTVDAAANQPPEASFTSSTDNLTVSTDGSASVDPDGSVQSFAWSWGDGSPNTNGPTSSHTYGAPGTYTVRLVVTDNDGATAATTRQVTVANASGFLVEDDFSRTVGSGLGEAEAGGSWQVSGPNSRWSVDGGKARFTIEAAGVGSWASLSGVSARDVTGRHEFSINRAATGGGVFSTTRVRQNGDNEYRLQIKVTSTGALQLSINKYLNGTETRLGGTIVPAGINYNAADTLKVAYSVSGSTSTVLQLKVWKSTDPEPADYQISRLDTNAAGAPLAGAGAYGQFSYLSGSATGLPLVVSYDAIRLSSQD